MVVKGLAWSWRMVRPCFVMIALVLMVSWVVWKVMTLFRILQYIVSQTLWSWTFWLLRFYWPFATFSTWEYLFQVRSDDSFTPSEMAVSTVLRGWPLVLSWYSVLLWVFFLSSFFLVTGIMWHFEVLEDITQSVPHSWPYMSPKWSWQHLALKASIATCVLYHLVLKWMRVSAHCT